MRKAYVVRLTDQERSQLEAMARSGTAATYQRIRAEVLLRSDQGERGPAVKDEQIARDLGIAERTVSRVRQRFVLGGLDAAINRRKQASPSRRRKFDAQAKAALLTIANGPPANGGVQWTLQSLADRLVQLGIVDSVSHETVRQALKEVAPSRE